MGLSTPGVFGQVCSGSLGENIFEDGDFGSGSDNILPNDPGIAPGYFYETNPPPEDGYYVITNNTGNWGFNYDTWLDIGDNSEDPEGYMMIVNASFDPGLFYDQEVTGLCENTQYEFSADVINLIRVNVSNHILPNVSFLINDLEVFTTGNIPQDENWHSYGFAFTTAGGQTSIKLSLRNNAPGGIGNDLALDNISFRPCGPMTSIGPDEFPDICATNSVVLEATLEGSQYDNPVIQWQTSMDGVSWQDIEGANEFTLNYGGLSGGNNFFRFFVANSPDNLINSRCRVLSVAKIVELPPMYFNLIDTICQGSEYLFGNEMLGTSGTYLDTFIAASGCDSIVELDLTIIPPTTVQGTWMATDQSCFNVADATISIFPDPDILPPFEVFINNQSLSSPYSLDTLVSGIYELLIQDGLGCTFQDLIEISAPEPFIVQLGNDTIIQSGQIVPLSIGYSEPILSTIIFPDSIQCPAPCALFEYFPTASSFLIAEATNLSGCLARDSIFIEVIQDRSIYFPNVFSPNNDGVNDYFNGFGRTPNIQIIEQLSIFDRWGNQIASIQNVLPNDKQSGWDGNYFNERALNGTYIYLAKVKFIDGTTKTMGGSITLIR